MGQLLRSWQSCRFQAVRCAHGDSSAFGIAFHGTFTTLMPSQAGPARCAYGDALASRVSLPFAIPAFGPGLGSVSFYNFIIGKVFL